MINTYLPDIFCVQEAGLGYGGNYPQSESYAWFKNLPTDNRLTNTYDASPIAYSGANYGDGTETAALPSHGLIIFFNKARFTLLDSGATPYSDAAQYYTSDVNQVRCYQWAKLKDSASGRTFYVFNTHLQMATKLSFEENKHYRELQAAELASAIEHIAGSEMVFVLGDFNSKYKYTSAGALSDQSTIQSFCSNAGFKDGLKEATTQTTNNVDTDKTLDHICC